MKEVKGNKDVTYFFLRYLDCFFTSFLPSLDKRWRRRGDVIEEMGKEGEKGK